MYQCFEAILLGHKCKEIRILGLKSLHLLFLMVKRIETHRHRTIAYCLFPTPTKRLFQQALRRRAGASRKLRLREE